MAIWFSYPDIYCDFIRFKGMTIEEAIYLLFWMWTINLTILWIDLEKCWQVVSLGICNFRIFAGCIVTKPCPIIMAATNIELEIVILYASI